MRLIVKFSKLTKKTRSHLMPWQVGQKEVVKKVVRVSGNEILFYPEVFNTHLIIFQ